MVKQTICKVCGKNRFHTYQSKGRVINFRFDACNYCNTPKTKRGIELSKII